MDPRRNLILVHPEKPTLSGLPVGAACYPRVAYPTLVIPLLLVLLALCACAGSDPQLPRGGGKPDSDPQRGAEAARARDNRLAQSERYGAVRWVVSERTEFPADSIVSGIELLSTSEVFAVLTNDAELTLGRVAGTSFEWDPVANNVIRTASHRATGRMAYLTRDGEVTVLLNPAADLSARSVHDVDISNHRVRDMRFSECGSELGVLTDDNVHIVSATSDSKWSWSWESHDPETRLRAKVKSLRPDLRSVAVFYRVQPVYVGGGDDEDWEDDTEVWNREESGHVLCHVYGYESAEPLVVIDLGLAHEFRPHGTRNCVILEEYLTFFGRSYPPPRRGEHLFVVRPWESQHGTLSVPTAFRKWGELYPVKPDPERKKRAEVGRDSWTSDPYWGRRELHSHSIGISRSEDIFAVACSYRPAWIEDQPQSNVVLFVDCSSREIVKWTTIEHNRGIALLSVCGNLIAAVHRDRLFQVISLSE
jgi:hypothetical protein